ncbi:MAG: hypothetical protein ACYSYM_10960 [Planctomycetota bacterium]|jgi:hypothetical protein
MESVTEKLSDRDKEEASIRLLRKLAEQLQSSDASTRRRAAYNLSWMQEDGLEILKGLKHRDNSARQVCRNALQLLGRKVPGGTVTKKQTQKKTRIREISHERKPRARTDMRRGIGTRRTR